MDPGLIDSTNPTAALIGGLVNDRKNTVAVTLTNESVGLGGAKTRQISSTRTEITMNLSEVRSTLVHARPLSGSSEGALVLGHMTAGPSLVHEFGHSAAHFAGFPIATPSLNRSLTKNFREALRYENLHRRLLKGPENFERLDHGVYDQ